MPRAQYLTQRNVGYNAVWNNNRFFINRLQVNDYLVANPWSGIIVSKADLIINNHYSEINGGTIYSLPAPSGNDPGIYLGGIDTANRQRSPQDYVLTWDGDPAAEFTIKGSSITSTTANRIEFTTDGSSDCFVVCSGGITDGVSNLKCFESEDEALVSAGAIWSPEFLADATKYDVMRHLNSLNTNANYGYDISEYDGDVTKLDQNIFQIDSIVNLAVTADNAIWIGLPPFLALSHKPRTLSFVENNDVLGVVIQVSDFSTANTQFIVNGVTYDIGSGVVDRDGMVAALTTISNDQTVFDIGFYFDADNPTHPLTVTFSGVVVANIQDRCDFDVMGFADASFQDAYLDYAHEGQVHYQAATDSDTYLPFCTELVNRLNSNGYELDVPIYLEFGNEIWNNAYPFVLSGHFVTGVGLGLGYTNRMRAYGHVSSAMAEAFAEALVTGNRASQVWSVALNNHLEIANETVQSYIGVSDYLVANPSGEPASRFGTSVTGYFGRGLRNATSQELMGETYLDDAAYVAAVAARAIDNPTSLSVDLRNFYLNADPIEGNVANITARTIEHQTSATNAGGFFLGQYEGGSHEAFYDSDSDYLNNYDFMVFRNNWLDSSYHAEVIIAQHTQFRATFPTALFSNFGELEVRITPDQNYGPWSERGDYDVDTPASLAWDAITNTPTSIGGAVLRNINSNVLGTPQVGIRGADIPATGTDGPSILYNDITQGTDDEVLVRAEFISVPNFGVGSEFIAYEDGSIALTGADDGSHAITYELFANGVSQGTATIDITVGAAADTTIPIITVSGGTTAMVEGGTYTPPTVTASDTVDGDITGSIVVSGDTVDANVPNTYTVLYNVADAAGNNAVQASHTVVVSQAADTTIPTITVSGGTTAMVEGGTYTPPTVTASDNVDGDITGSIVVSGDTVDANVPNTYTVLYNVADAAGNNAVQASHTVVVSQANATPPAILVNGGTTFTHEGGTYTPPTVTAIDSSGNDITGSIVVSGDTVNVNTEGVYTILYDVADGSGNNATQVSRVVTIRSLATRPVITVTGGITTVFQGGIYTPPTVTIRDNTGPLSDEGLFTSGDTVDVSVADTYTILYDFPSGNSALTASHTVVVLPSIGELAAFSTPLSVNTITTDGFTLAFGSNGAGYASVEVIQGVWQSQPSDVTFEAGKFAITDSVQSVPVTALSENQSYTIWVRIENNFGTYAYTTIEAVTALTGDVTPPGWAAALEISPVTPTGFDVRFAPDGAGLASVIVLAGVNQPEPSAAEFTAARLPHATVASNWVTFPVEDLENESDYTVWVRIEDGAGNYAVDSIQQQTLGVPPAVLFTQSPYVTSLLSSEAAISFTVDTSSTYRMVVLEGAFQPQPTEWSGSYYGITAGVASSLPLYDLTPETQYTVWVQLYHNDGFYSPTTTNNLYFTTTATDAVIPVISVSGGDATLVAGETYTPPTVVAYDSVGTQLTVTTSGDTVNPNVAGVYRVVYNATDGDGNTAFTRSHTVSVAPDSNRRIFNISPRYHVISGDVVLLYGADDTLGGGRVLLLEGAGQPQPTDTEFDNGVSNIHLLTWATHAIAMPSGGDSATLWVRLHDLDLNYTYAAIDVYSPIIPKIAYPFEVTDITPFGFTTRIGSEINYTNANLVILPGHGQAQPSDSAFNPNSISSTSTRRDYFGVVVDNWQIVEHTQYELSPETDYTVWLRSGGVYYSEDITTAAVPVGNNPPTIITGTDTIEVYRGQTLEVQLEATDPNGDGLTWYAYEPPSGTYWPGEGMTQSGLLTLYQPVGGEESNYSITVYVTDGYHEVGPLTIPIHFNGDLANQWEQPVITLTGGTPNIGINGPVDLPVATCIDWLDNDWSASIVVTGTVDNTTPGTYEIVYSLDQNELGDVDDVTYTVTVGALPTIGLSGGTNTVIQGRAVDYPVATVTDEVDAPVIINPTGVVYNTIIGDYDLTYNHTNSRYMDAVEVVYTISVLENVPPVIASGGTIEVVRGNTETLQLSATDSDTDGTPLTWQITTHPSLLLADVNINASTGLLTVNSSVFESGSTTVLQVTATDDFSASDPVTITINVRESANWDDAIPPTITLLGGDTVVELGGDFNPPTATADDNIDGDISADIVVTGSVDTDVLGPHTLYYNVTDSAGNAAVQQEFTATVTISAPVISVTGGDTTVEVGGPFTPPTVTANDLLDGDISGDVVTTGSVDTSTVDTYTLYYDVTDSDGNAAVQQSFTVNVVDTTAPTITLTGGDTTVEVDGTFNAPTATADDGYDGDITGSIAVTGSVDVNTVGSYTLYYDVSDANGNAAAQQSFTVNVVDTTIPSITLTGGSTTAEAGGAYTAPTATAVDGYDGVITDDIIVTGSVDTGILGPQTLFYNVADAAGNNAVQQSFTITVVDTTAPTITVTGGNATAPLGGSPTYPNVSATDSYDGDLTDDIITTGSVDTGSLGTYTLYYDVADSSGNAAVQQSFTIEVVDSTAPVITLEGGSPSIAQGDDVVMPVATATDNLDAPVVITPTGSIDNERVGTYRFTYNHTDTNGNAADTVYYDIVVTNRVPVITSPLTITIAEGSTGTYTPTADDLDAVTFAVAEVPLWGVFNGQSITFNPPYGTVGERTFTLFAIDSEGGTASAEVIVTVTPAQIGDSPVVGTTPITHSTGTCMDIIAKIRDLIHDVKDERHTDAELIAWANEGVIELFKANPQTNSATLLIPTQAGVFQEAPANVYLILDVFANANGYPITESNARILDLEDPLWRISGATNTAYHWTRVSVTSSRFDLYPPRPDVDPEDIMAVAAYYPAQITSINSAFPLRNEYQQAIVSYVVSRVLVKEDDNQENANTAMTHKTLFEEAKANA